jgi:hypothetical protein
METSRFPCKRLLRMPGSTTTRGRHVSCDIDTRRVAFCGTENISTPNLSYAAQYLACALPCERFTSALADNPCITRGQCGSLHLHRDGLPPSTFCRSPGAPVHTWSRRSLKNEGIELPICTYIKSIFRRYQALEMMETGHRMTAGKDYFTCVSPKPV